MSAFLGFFNVGNYRGNLKIDVMLISEFTR